MIPEAGEIRCGTCCNYAWHGAQRPLVVVGEKHHPACARIRPLVGALERGRAMIGDLPPAARMKLRRFDVSRSRGTGRLVEDRTEVGGAKIDTSKFFVLPWPGGDSGDVVAESNLSGMPDLWRRGAERLSSWVAARKARGLSVVALLDVDGQPYQVFAVSPTKAKELLALGNAVVVGEASLLAAPPDDASLLHTTGWSFLSTPVETGSFVDDVAEQLERGGLKVARAAVESGLVQTHPAIALARPDTRPVLVRLMRAFNVPLACPSNVAHAMVAKHAREQLAGRRGNLWMEIASFLNDPVAYLERREGLEPDVEVIGAADMFLRGDAASIPFQEWADGQPLVVRGPELSPRRPGSPPHIYWGPEREYDDDEIGAETLGPSAGPGIVTPAALHAFVARVDLGYQAFDRDVQGARSYAPAVVDANSAKDLETWAASPAAQFLPESAKWAKARAELVKIGKAPKLLSENFVTGWKEALEAWGKVRDEYGSAYLFSGSAWDTVETSRRDLERWHTKFEEELGRKPSSAIPVAPTDPGGSGVGTQVKDLAVGLGLLALLLFIVTKKL